MRTSKYELALALQFLRGEDGPAVQEVLRKSYSRLVLAEGPGPGLDEILAYELCCDSYFIRRISTKKGEIRCEERFGLDQLWDQVLDDFSPLGWLLEPTVIEIDKLRAMLPQPAVRKTR